MLLELKEGLYKDVHESVYRSLPAASYSTLKGFAKTPAHARERMVHPKPSTPAQELGRATHLAILEPNRFSLEYVAAPDVDRRTKAGKAEWAAFDAEHPDATLLKPEDFAACCSMRDAIWAHPLASAILGSQGMREVSAVWQDVDTGEWCKARPDLLCRWDGRSVIVDVKSTKDASPFWFGRDANRFHYDSQLAFYKMGLAAIAPADRGAVIVAIENEAPFAIGVYAVPVDVLELGSRKAARWLKTYAECKKAESWPGYPVELMNLEIPTYAWKEDADE